MERKFKKGDKVVPHSKSVDWGYSFEDCAQWKDAKEKNQPFLYVSNWNEDEEAYALVSKMGYVGNFYKEFDLTLYQEPTKNEKVIVVIYPFYEHKEYTYSDGTINHQSILIEEDSHQVIFNGTTTIVTLNDGSKGVSKLDPKDTYDKNIGYTIAYHRANIERSNKEIKRLKKKSKCPISH